MTTRIASLDGGRIVRRFAAAILFVASLYYLRLTIELYAFWLKPLMEMGCAGTLSFSI